jgi:hypothetical protein
LGQKLGGEGFYFLPRMGPMSSTGRVTPKH